MTYFRNNVCYLCRQRASSNFQLEPYNILIVSEQAIKLIRDFNCPVRAKEVGTGKTDG